MAVVLVAAVIRRSAPAAPLRACRPMILSVGCGSDAQVEDNAHDPWQGRRFGYPVSYQDWPSCCDDKWWDCWWRLQWGGPYQSGEWSYGGSVQPRCGT